MAKQLILIRHAKSDWGSASLTDYNRPLNRRGNEDAPEMANRLIKQRIVPSLVLSSPANRALTTARYFANAWHIDSIQEVSNIYEANVSSLLSIVNQLDNSNERIALFGHNPGLTDFVNYLADANIFNMPTCSVAIIEFMVDSWQEVSAESGKVILFDYPKSIYD